MVRRAQDRFARAVSEGLRAGALCFAVLTLVLGWFTEAVALVGRNGVPGVLVPALGTLLALAGVCLLAVGVPRHWRVAKVVAAVALAQLGFLTYLLTVRQNPAVLPSTAAFSLSLFKMALIAGSVNAGRRWGPALVGTITLLLSEATAASIGPVLGYPWVVDGSAIAALAFLLAASLGFGIARARGTVARRAVAALQDEDTLRQARTIVRSRAAAVVHDTVLNDLAVLATTEPGALSRPLAERLFSTLELLASPDWVQGAAPEGVPGAPGAAVQRAIDRATSNGLTVRIDGEVGALGALDPNVEHELGRAVEQCLVNTLKHAGTDEAEITVLASDADVSVMVADSGDGFVLDDVDGDRRGLRGSVQSRIEDVGGTVRIFATPGVGTTILMSVPLTAAPTETAEA